ncbi:hypothetical protein ABTC57_18920, partial [Acinetobacter baumannii]
VQFAFSAPDQPLLTRRMPAAPEANHFVFQQSILDGLRHQLCNAAEWCALKVLHVGEDLEVGIARLAEQESKPVEGFVDLLGNYAPISRG